jgi:hypothetical protein
VTYAYAAAPPAFLTAAQRERSAGSEGRFDGAVVAARPLMTGVVQGGIEPAGETKNRREHEADKSSEWRGRVVEYH